MHRKLLSALALVLVAALLGVAAGCGGDDEESGAAEATPATTQATTAEEAAEQEPAEEEPVDTQVSDVMSADDCRELAELGTELQGALSGTAEDPKAYADFLQELADRAPEEIQADFQIVADSYGKLAEVLAEVDVQSGETPSPEALQRLQEATQSIDQQALTQASTNIATWVQENCQP